MDEFVSRPKGRSQPQALPSRTQPSSVLARTVAIPVVKAPAPDIPPPPSPTQSPKKSGKKFSFKLPEPKNRLQWALFAGIIGVVVATTGFAVYWFLLRPEPAPITYVAPVIEPEPVKTTVASKTTGREIQPKTNDRNIYAVQIENSPDARPQSGLRDADIISEAVAEGGITRFNAVFHDNIPANIGPVRSLRPYYVDWFLPYTSAIVHAGGPPEALALIKTRNLQDMDNNPGYFRRVTNRYAPHNLYTTGNQMLDLFTKRGYKPTQVTSLPRQEAAPDKSPAASSINLRISSALYNVDYKYDKASNTYLRSEGGKAHVDAETGKQLAPSVVVVPVLVKGLHPDGIHTTYETRGRGKVYVFQDGTVTVGRWTKARRTSQWELEDSSGKTIKLSPGQTWFTMVDSAGAVTYK